MDIGLLGGRLMRAAVCGLLAAAVLPSSGWSASPVATGSSTVVIDNPCFATDTIVLTIHTTVYSDVQPDGSLRFYVSAAGSGVSLTTEAKYAVSEELHEVFDIDLTNIRFYDYLKITRQRDEAGVPVIVDPPTGTGDDFVLRMYFEIPGATGGGPSSSSLMTVMEGTCR